MSIVVLKVDTSTHVSVINPSSVDTDRPQSDPEGSMTSDVYYIHLLPVA